MRLGRLESQLEVSMSDALPSAAPVKVPRALGEDSGRPSMEGANAVLSSASVFYGEVVGLSKVDLGLGPGITGIVGPNGSGKTTLMRVLTGLIEPNEGTVRVFGGSPFESAEIRRRISFVPATECFFEGLSGRRNLEIAFLSHGYSRRDARERAGRALDTVKLTADGNRRYGTWSRGMRQRLKLGLTLSSDSELVLLDEPFLGVDPPSRRDLRELILSLGQSGRTVLVSSHVLHEVESLTHTVGVIAHGRLLGFGEIGTLLVELRDRHPHRIELEVDEARRMAEHLIRLPHVSEIRLVSDHVVEFVSEQPEVAYKEIPALLSRSGVLARRLRTMDDTLEAVFTHVTQAGTRRL